jgi:hypothetical protein
MVKYMSKTKTLGELHKEFNKKRKKKLTYEQYINRMFKKR